MNVSVPRLRVITPSAVSWRQWWRGSCLIFAFCQPGSSVAQTTLPYAGFTYPTPLNFTYSQGQTATRSEVRDPCIVRDGDTYHLVFTMWPFSGRDEKNLARPNQGGSPGVALYGSKDLKDWTFEKWLIKSSDLPDDCPYKNRFWAPEIHKIDAKYYLIFTADNWIDGKNNKPGKWGSAGYCFIGVADTITGPYRHVTYVEGGTCDMTLFADTDGKTYAIKPKSDIFLQQIDLTRLEQGQAKFIGPEKRIVTCNNADIGLKTSPAYLEGPWLEKIGDRYCLFHATLYNDRSSPWLFGYRTNVAYADSIAGPWTKDPRGTVFYGGHLAVFDGPDGRKWFSYRKEKPGPDRGLLCVDPISFDADGRVRVAEAGQSAPAQLPSK